MRLLELPDGQARRIGERMRLFVSGSAPLPAHILEAFRAKFGHTTLERYGMSETLMNISNPYEGERRPGSVGFPLPGVSIRILDAEMKPMAEGGCVASFDPKIHPSFFIPGEKLPCGLIQDTAGSNGTTLILDAAGVGLNRIAGVLSGLLDRYVVDKTGETGVFTVHLEFARDETVRQPRGGSPPAAPSDVQAGPTVFTALAQLGLKLAADKGPHGFIVIEHVERPSEN